MLRACPSGGVSGLLESKVYPEWVKGNCPGLRGRVLKSVIVEVVVVVGSYPCLCILPYPYDHHKICLSAVGGKTVVEPDIEEGVLGPGNKTLVDMPLAFFLCFP